MAARGLHLNSLPRQVLASGLLKRGEGGTSQLLLSIAPRTSTASAPEWEPRMGKSDSDGLANGGPK